ncbi:hypothetical protein HYV85_02615 [Candidatus Woesearchaeota archaeon]|nr:hypothetical protein [Candidatus Woesearchaeota archaeon]
MTSVEARLKTGTQGLEAQENVAQAALRGFIRECEKFPRSGRYGVSENRDAAILNWGQQTLLDLANGIVYSTLTTHTSELVNPGEIPNELFVRPTEVLGLRRVLEGQATPENMRNAGTIMYQGGVWRFGRKPRAPLEEVSGLVRKLAEGGINVKDYV